MAQEETAEASDALEEITSIGTDQIYSASQWQLMWWRLKRHKLAMIASITPVSYTHLTLPTKA